MIIIDKNAKREVQVKYPDRTRVLFPNLDDGYISSNDVVIPGINAPISDDGVGVASINDGAEGNAISKLVIGIDPVQDLHGQSNPYPPGGGKNKFDVTAGAYKVLDSSTGEVGEDNPLRYTTELMTLADGDWIFSFGSDMFALGVAFYNSSGTFVSYENKNYATGSITFTTSSNKVRVYFGSAEHDNLVAGLAVGQLEVGSTATAWSPYSNICPISGHTQTVVTRTGKNLLDNVNPDVVNAYIGNIGGEKGLVSNQNNRTVIIPVESNTTYTYSFNRISLTTSTDDSNVILFDKYPQLNTTIGTLTGVLMYNGDKRTFTTSATTKYIAIKIANINNTDFSGTLSASQLELGSTATTYEPYTANTYTIDLDGTRYGGTLDVTTGVLTVDRILGVFNGSEAWSEYTSHEGYYYRPTNMKTGTRQDGVSNMLSDSKIGTTGQKNAMWLGVNSNILFAIGVYESMGSTLADFKSYLSQHNLEVVYPLNTPFTVQLTAQEVTTLLGQNNIWADCGNVLELSYSANMNIRLQDLLDEKLDKPTTPGTLGQVLTSDGEGGQTWETPE